MKSNKTLATDPVEIGPYDHLNIDDPIIVFGKDCEYRRYFAGIDEDGRPTAWEG